MELTRVLNASMRRCQSSADRAESVRMKVSMGLSSTWPRGATPWRVIGYDNYIGALCVSTVTLGSSSAGDGDVKEG